jgi:hypothetical protein
LPGTKRTQRQYKNGQPADTFVPHTASLESGLPISRAGLGWLPTVGGNRSSVLEQISGQPMGKLECIRLISTVDEAPNGE